MTQITRESTSGAAVLRRPRPELPRRVGPWDLVELAAEGALARVYRARPADTSPDRPGAYAVKLLRPEWEDDARAVRMLVREAVAGRSASHPHLVPIFRANLRQAPRYFVMPWLEGATLRSRLDAGRLVDVPVTLWIARQVAEALGALHTAGWMHGDVKPCNVLLSPEGHVTLLDLGFARRSDETGSAVDRFLAGTFNYLAPEQITSSLGADVRSDIYSLGVVLFELLSGRLPFAGRDLAELAEQHQQAVPPSLQRLAPHLPAAVVSLIHQMLAKEPLRRPQTPGELTERLLGLEITTFSERAL